MLLLYILRVGISRFICKKNSFDSVVRFVFFVYDNKDAKPKRAFSIYFTFLLPKRLGMPFRKEKSHAKCTKKVYDSQHWFSKFRSDMKTK